MSTTPESATGSGLTSARLAYFWGDDAYGIEAAIEAFRRDRNRFPEGEPERWRPEADGREPARLLGELRERLATGTMWGAGSLAIVSGAGAMVRSKEQAAAFASMLVTIAPGNGLLVAEVTESSVRDCPSTTVAEAMRAAGAAIRQFKAPGQRDLAGWIEARARERGIALARGAAQELATRVAGNLSQNDIDRRHQGRTAVMELEKLALRHFDGAPITVENVRELVPEAVPGSMWAFVDAVGMRQRARSLELLERVIEEKPAPVLLSVLHARIRDLLEVQDRLARGESPGSLVRSMRLNEFRAETLARQARAWTGPELDAALDGLVALDAQVKGVGGRRSSDARDRLAFDLWITDRVAPA
ncbi:MAG TPA: DNA polymerase III subunit delta [Candidatus Binatia bacterium]|nr:DNA polymerase III subunit delta [Candidatus Binatia bacterium]